MRAEMCTLYTECAKMESHNQAESVGQTCGLNCRIRVDPRKCFGGLFSTFENIQPETLSLSLSLSLSHTISLRTFEIWAIKKLIYFELQFVTEKADCENGLQIRL